MKKFFSFLMAFTMIFTQVINVNALEVSNDNEPEITNVKINGNMISCQADKKDVTYDLDKEIIKIGDSTIYLKTTVDYVADDIPLTKEELLQYDKEMIKQQFINHDKNRNEASVYKASSSLSPQVPSNAKYVVAVNYSKDVAQIIAQLDTVASDISAVTGVLSLLGVIPATSIVNYIVVAYAVGKTAFSKIKLTVTGTWKYTLERTTQAWPAGNTKQICYRYAHSRLTLKVKCSLGSKNIDKKQSKKGGWWVASKPY